MCAGGGGGGGQRERWGGGGVAGSCDFSGVCDNSFNLVNGVAQFFHGSQLCVLGK